MKKNLSKPELVAPAGNWSALKSAVNSGADSVYFGVKGLNMRNLASNFDLSEIKKLVSVLHKSKKRAYLALNVIIYNKEINKVKKILTEAKKGKVDGVILWDMAVFKLAKELDLPIHLSTQASVSNFLALKNYSAQGVKRVVLARECRLSEIKAIASEIKKQAINCKIEAFVHGAMCISVSGRCFLSEYSFSKSANRGECLQPCRRKFLITDSDDESQYILGKDYLLSPKDLCTIDFIDQLIESGISAFKIEGRIRSSEYVSVVTSVYRRAIDAYFFGCLTKKLKAELKKELATVYNRGFSSGFYFGKPKDSTSRNLDSSYEKVYVGEVIKFYKKIGVAEIWVRDHDLKKGDRILCVGKATPASFAMVSDIQINHAFVDQLKRGEKGGLKVPFTLKRNDKVFIWRKK
ncbi:MAG: U32 family peptidase [Candidatus Omnitrophica bacterium]|nr:U32 family peptidase [Candidatus Omnitrophota bacterium]